MHVKITFWDTNLASLTDSLAHCDSVRVNLHILSHTLHIPNSFTPRSSLASQLSGGSVCASL